ncbi:hypothetical protein [Maribacter forsetii]|uniref:hypothetical protein n=1 Tax=Maribacter forsetii TaxID=444515 RepID=UPI00056907DD|nr:hypothetical protein [Maribacter forsetii]
MQKNTFFIFCLFFTWLGLSQEIKLPLGAVTGSSGQLLENIHLHLNKTSFASGEHVWFTAYIQNQKTLLPSVVTENLHVGIYDDFGKEINRKLLRVDKGIAHGDFEIDSTFERGSYHIIAWTNYSRNFEKLESFHQQIEILGNTNDNEIKGTAKIELNTYPEGGALISGVFNYIGIHLKNNFKDHKPIVKLLDDNGEVLVSNINISEEGFGKIGFFIKENQNYFFEIQNSDGEISTIPLKKSLGLIGLSIDNTGDNQLLAKLVLSDESLIKNNNKTYSLAIVQEDSVFMQAWVVNKNQLALSIDRRSIPYGVNKAILFDERQRPIAYRMFFNHIDKSSRVKEINVRHRLNTSGDSLELSFSTLRPQSLEYNLSVSVLPLYTEANNPQNSLASSFLIKPYVSSRAKYKYEFSNFDGFQNYDLDIKLMIEGWGKNEWKDRLAIKSNEDFELEKGIAISGRVLDADLAIENQVLLMTDKSKTIAFEKLQRDKTFRTHMMLYENDSLEISLIGKKGVLRMPKLEIKVDSSWMENQIDVLKLLKDYRGVDIVSNNYDDEISISFKKNDEVIVLEEAIVKADKWKDNSLKINSAEIEGRQIGDYEIKRYLSVSNYLRKLGFLIGGDLNGKTVVKSKSINLRTGSNLIVPLYIVGIGRGEEIALNMPLSRVQTIVHDARKNAFVTIMLKDDVYVFPENRNKYIRQYIRYGYAKINEYYNPGYEDYESIVFKKYGALYWKSNIPVTSKEPFTIKVPLKNQEGVKVFVEGISEDGTLISLEKKINLKSEVNN